MKKNRQSRMAGKARNKGRAVSFLIHAALLLIAFLPFLSMQAPAIPSKEALVIQFDYPYNEYVAPEKFVVENMTQGSMMNTAGSEAGGSTASEDPIQPRPIEAAPSRISAPAMSAISPTSSPLSSKTSDIPLPTPKIVKQQAWQAVNDFNSFESDEVEELTMIGWSDGGKGDVAGSTDGDDDSDVWNTAFGSGTGGSGTGNGGGPGNATGNGSGPGGGTGTGGAGKGSGLGGIGSGLKFTEAYGEGNLSRSLVHRPPRTVNELAVKEGRICIYLCVDKFGKVVTSQYILEKSTIKDIPLLVKAQAIAKEYVFVPDIMGPEKECGNFYYVIKLPSSK